jgi:hypothetical protein
MSLQPKEITPVPEETVRVARAAFPKGNAWLSLRDELGTIYSDEMFAGLYPRSSLAGTFRQERSWRHRCSMRTASIEAAIRNMTTWTKSIMPVKP